VLPAGTKILLKTTPSGDKYGRSVADVWFRNKEGKEQYLNSLILQEGYAIKVGD